jgi:hypothetical protein
MQEAVWVGCQPQPWHNDIILTPQVTQNPKFWSNYCGYLCLCKSTTLWQWTAYQCAQALCICLRWRGGAVWVGRQPQTWHSDIILTPQVIQNPKIWSNYSGYNCVRLLPYAYRQHVNVLKHFVHILWARGAIVIAIYIDTPLRSFFRSDMVRSWQTDRYLFLHHFYRYKKLEMFPWFFCHMFLRGPTWESKEYLLGLMYLDLVSIVLEVWSRYHIFFTSYSFPCFIWFSDHCCDCFL